MAIPPTASRWSKQLDPGDLTPFIMNMAPLLDVANGEQINPADWTLTMSAEGVALGCEIGSSGGYAPSLSSDGTRIGLYLSVAAGSQASAGFDSGVDVAIVARFGTTATPANRYERTFVVRVVNK